MRDIVCGCGEKLHCHAFTNTCKCGRDYNWNGTMLAPREQWGEETGETWEEIIEVDHNDQIRRQDMGVSKRDYFAGLAMQTMVQAWLDLSPSEALEGKECISEFAYEVADAMLKARQDKISKGSCEKMEAESKAGTALVSWAADQFEIIENAIAANSVGYAQAHAQRCAAEMSHGTDLSEETEN